MTSYYGDYVLSYTTAEDFPAVLDLVVSKDQIEDPSKRDAVYKRHTTVLDFTVTHGLCTKIERVARNDEEYSKLGNKEKSLIAITNGYLIGFDAEGKHVEIATETAKNRAFIKGRASEVGTTFSNPAKDIPGDHPSRCMYRLLVAATQMNLFRLAGQEVGGRVLAFDTMTANVQNREQMRVINNWLTTNPLGWRMLEKASQELKDATRDTIDKDINFQQDKFYFEALASNFPMAAQYMLDIYERGNVVSDHDYDQHVAPMRFELPTTMLPFLYAVANGQEYFTANSGSSLTDIRRRLYIPNNDYSQPVRRTLSADGRSSTYTQSGSGHIREATALYIR